jgi:energy-converting hydrogenase Eha subunit E
MITATTLAGFGAIALGYLMTVILGGFASLKLIKFISHLMHSKQIIELPKTPITSNRKTVMLEWLHWVYAPAVVFISAVGLGWDTHNGDGPGAGVFQPVMHSLDVFSRPTIGTSPILLSRQLIPALLILVAIAGFVPSIVLPYFRKFRVTGVNAGPFHTTLLLSSVAAMAGLGVFLTLVGLFYRTLWLHRAPLPYHFGILALLGFALHFCLGMYLGANKADANIIRSIRNSQSGRLIVLA